MSATSTDSEKLADPMVTDSAPPLGAAAEDDAEPEATAGALDEAPPDAAGALAAALDELDEPAALGVLELELPQAVRASAPAANAAITAVARVRFMFPSPCEGSARCRSQVGTSSVRPDSDRRYLAGASVGMAALGVGCAGPPSGSEFSMTALTGPGRWDFR